MFLCPIWLNSRLTCLFCFCLFIPAFLHRGHEAVCPNKMKTTGEEETREAADS